MTTELSVEQPSGRQGAPRWWSVAQPWVSTVLRLGLAAVWIAAGWSKVTDLGNSVRSVRAYELGIPDVLVQIIGAGLPFLELALALLLILGVGTRFVSAFSALLFAIFIAGIASAWARGLKIDCGCFSSSGGQLPGGVDPAYAIEIVRDIGFIAMAVLLVIWPLSALSVDGLLRRIGSGTTAADLEDGDEDEEKE